MQALDLVVMKQELSKKAKLSVFVPVLTYGHEPWPLSIHQKNTITSANV